LSLTISLPQNGANDAEWLWTPRPGRDPQELKPPPQPPMRHLRPNEGQADPGAVHPGEK
jgi:hypothetical protein